MEGWHSRLLFCRGKGIRDRKGKWVIVFPDVADIMPTILEATGAKYPETYHGGNKIYPLVGGKVFFLLSIRNGLLA